MLALAFPDSLQGCKCLAENRLQNVENKSISRHLALCGFLRVWHECPVFGKKTPQVRHDGMTRGATHE